MSENVINNVINMDEKRAELEINKEVVTEQNQKVTNPEEKVEITMLEYVNNHFSGIRDAMNETNRIIHLIDKMNFNEMCKLEAVITILVDKLGINQEEFITKYKEILARYQENVNKDREETKKDVKNISEQEAEDIREEIKQEVGEPPETPEVTE